MSSSNSPNTAALFTSSGDMAARTRALDGASSSVGAPSTWPRSLTNAVRLLLWSRHPMFLWWGPDLTNFYNDAYGTILGERHPWALGRPAKEVWTEIWPDLVPLVESVLVRGEATWNENFPLIVERNGYPEEAFFTFSYSPAPDDDGNVGGLFCAVTEETQRVLAKRRLQTLRELALSSAQAWTVPRACELALDTLAQNPHDVPFAAVYLLQADGPRADRCARAGIAADALPAVIVSGEPGPWPFAEVLESKEPVYVEDARERVGDLVGGAWPEPCGTVALLPIVQAGHDRVQGILVAGVSPRLPLDELYRDFLVMVAAAIGNSIAGARVHEEAEALADAQRATTLRVQTSLDEVRRALEARVDSETRLRAAPRASSTGTYRWDVRSGVVERDAALAALFGLSPEEGGTIDDYTARVHEGDRSRWLTVLEQARAGANVDVEYRTVWPDGSVHWILDRARMVRDEEGAPLCMTGAALEITSQKRAQAITTLFADFEGVEHNVSAALAVAAELLPLRTAILIEEAGAGPAMTVWCTEDATPAELARSRKHAESAYGYLVGSATPALSPRPGAITLPPRGATWGPAPDERKRFIVLPLVVSRVFGALQLEADAPLCRSDLTFVGTFVNQLAISLDRLRAWRREIAAREHAEALTRKHEALVDNLHSAFVWEADARTLRLSYVSARAETLLGYPRSQWLDPGDAWLHHVHPADRTLVRLTLQQVLADGRDQRIDHRWLARDGRTLWFHTGVHLEDGDAEAPLLQGVSVDVTAAKEAEEQLREQLGFTRAMSASLGEGVIAIDLDGRVTVFNRAAEELLGWTEAEVLGEELDRFLRFPIRGGGDVRGPLQRAMNTGRTVRGVERALVRGDGTSIPVSYAAAPILTDWEVTGAVLAFSDITERRRAEEAQQFLLEASEVLGASLDRADSLQRLARLAVPRLGDFCLFDVVTPDGAALERIACSHADPDRQGDLDEAFGCGSKEPVVPTAVAEAIRTGEPWLAPDAGDGWLEGSTPSHADLERLRGLAVRSVMTVPLRLGERRLGALTFCFARSARRHDPQDLAVAKELARRAAFAVENGGLFDEAQRAARAREQVLAVVSHDLRTPLATVLMSTEFVTSALRPDADRRLQESLQRTQRAAKQMERLIADLLDVVSVQSGRLSIKPESIEPASLVTEAAVSFEATARAARVWLSSELEPGVPQVSCDRMRVLQVLSNLINNALKVTPAGGAVTVRARAGAREVLFVVSDTGPGIAADQLPRLFERFWRGPDAGYQGTGLGLAISKGIVEAHGGRIWVDSTPGEGATFTFALPVDEASRG